MGSGRLLADHGMPLLRLPEAWPRPVVAVAAMAALAGLDLAGALLARRWAHGGSLLWFGAGAGCFVVLFWVYGSSLRYAELVPVTFGWIAALQVGLVAVAGRDHAVPARSWVAAAAIIALEGYLLASAESG